MLPTLCTFVSVFAAQGPPGRAASLRPSEILDFVAVARGKDSLILACDGTNPAVYAHTLWHEQGADSRSQKEPKRLTATDFLRFVVTPGLATPVAIGINGSDLYMLDSGTRSITIHNLDTNKSEVTPAPELDWSAGLALGVSPRRTIFLLERDRGRVTVIQPGIAPRRIDLRSRGVLGTFVSDGVSVALYAPEAGALEVLSDVASDPTTLDSTREVPLFGSATAIGAYRGTHYVLDPRGLHIFSRFSNRHAPHVLPRPRVSPRADLVRADEWRLYFRAADGPIEVVPRPVPIVAEFPIHSAEAEDGLIELYDYLTARDLLPVRTASISAQSTPLNALVHALGLTLSSSTAALHDTRAAGRVAAAVCRLNAASCNEHRARLAGESEIVLPDLVIERRAGQTSLRLGPESLRKRLRRVESPLGDLSARDLRSIIATNPEVFGTLEHELNRRDFTLLLGPRTAFDPGMQLAATKPLDFVADSECRKGIVRRRTKSLTLPPLLATTTLDGLIPSPFLGGLKPSLDKIVKSVRFVELTIDSPYVTAADIVVSELSRTPSCLREGSVLVTDVLRAKRLNLRLLGENGVTIRLPPIRLKTSGMTMVSGSTSTWSLSLIGDVGMAYRAVSRSSEASSAPVTFDAVEPTPRQIDERGVLNVSGRRLVVPITRWRTTLPVLSMDLNDDRSELAAIQADHNFRWLSLQQMVSRSHARFVRTSTAVLPGRQRLFTHAHYPRSLIVPPAGIVVGVAEDKATIDFSHPGFLRDDGQSVWLGVTANAVATEKPEIVLRELREDAALDHHGTHVAGIIAGQDPGFPGLHPAAGLVPIDVPPQDRGLNADSLCTEMANAVENLRARIVNISVDFKDPNGAFKATLFNKIREDWHSALFVVAAGNDTSPVDLMTTPPIVWAKDAANILGVGASNDSGAILPASNFGRAHVHILAPGQEIFSQLKGNRFGVMSGTSQAAPTVASAAALLWAKLQHISAPWVKARLIYTSDWNRSLRDNVWGGLINIERAVTRPDANIILLNNFPETPCIFEPRIDAGNSPKVVFTKTHGEVYLNEWAGTPSEDLPSDVSIDRVLRVHVSDPSHHRFRVVFLAKDTKKLKIVLDASLSGKEKIPCLSLEPVVPVSVGEREGLAAACAEGISVLDLREYVARIPAGQEVAF